METLCQLLLASLALGLPVTRAFLFGLFQQNYHCDGDLVATVSQDFHLSSTIIHKVQLQEARLVHKVHFRLNNCPSDLGYGSMLVGIQYIDASDVLKTEITYGNNMTGWHDPKKPSLTFAIAAPLYTGLLSVTTPAALECATLTVRGCDVAAVCASTACSNGGTCIGEGVCACAKGFFGKNCDHTLTDMPIDDFTPTHVGYSHISTRNGDFLIDGQVRLLNTNKRHTYGSVYHMSGHGGSLQLHQTYSSQYGGQYTHAHSSSSCSVYDGRTTSGFCQSRNVQFQANHDHSHEVHFYNTHQNYDTNNAGCSLVYRNNMLSMCVNNGYHRHEMHVPWIPSPGQIHTVTSSYSPHYGCSLFVNNQHLGSVNRPLPFQTNTQPANLCFGSCNNFSPDTSSCDYMLSTAHNIGMNLASLALNGLLALTGLQPATSPTNQLNPSPSVTVPPTVPPTTPPTTTPLLAFSATGGQVHATAVAQATGGGLLCYSCSKSSTDGSCLVPKQCNVGDVCALFHDPSGYTHTCLPKNVCSQAKQLTSSNCWICCDYSLCNKQCQPTASCSDTSSCAVLQSTGYDVCGDKKAAVNECQQTCGLCGSGR